MKRKNHPGIAVKVWSGFCGVLLLTLPSSAQAHNGPPFPIMENQRVGPCVISLWTHPDVGTGTFYVIVDPVAGGTIPKDLKVEIGIQPESGRLPEVLYNAERDDTRGQVDYKTLAQFDRDTEAFVVSRPAVLPRAERSRVHRGAGDRIVKLLRGTGQQDGGPCIRGADEDDVDGSDGESP